MSILDYRGFRVIALSVLPINKETIMYGSNDAGRYVPPPPSFSLFPFHLSLSLSLFLSFLPYLFMKFLGTYMQITRS
jgi:hypothetical protein